MRAVAVTIAVVLAALPAAGADRPNPQLLAQIEARLPFYQVQTDVSRLSLSQAAALHLTMTSGSEKWLEKRRKIKAILRRGEGIDG